MHLYSSLYTHFCATYVVLTSVQTPSGVAWLNRPQLRHVRAQLSKISSDRPQQG